MSERLPDLHRRASDADRDAVAERLRDAAGDGRLTIPELEERLEQTYAAKTYAELEPLTHDLPDHVPAAGRPLRPRDGHSVRVTGREGRRWSFALMSGTSRSGRWALSRTHNAIAVMGGVDLDLRDAELETAEVTVRVLALMGGVDIVVPDDCVLDASGFGLMGGFDEVDRAAPPPVGAPVVRVRGLALMGGVTALRKPRRIASEVEGPRRRELGS